LTDCKIVASNSLDEYIITELLNEGAKIDSFGVGERLITAKSDPVFGGVYKLTAVEKDGKIIPKIKISENSAKIINPGHKKIVRFYDNVSGKALADLLCLAHEEIDTSNDYTIFDPVETWKTKTIYDYHIKELQVPIYKDGKLVYDRPGIEEIRAYCKKEVDSFWDEVKRLVNPHKYYVDLSKELWDLKDSLLKEYSKK
jgi:nicotinate phosphoribosyltransferase